MYREREKERKREREKKEKTKFQKKNKKIKKIPCDRAGVSVTVVRVPI